MSRATESAGTLAQVAGELAGPAWETRYLYKGYRYESPLAGWQVDAGNLYITQNRQKGGNFTGLYYTLHRHYDPFLMSFTSPDLAAAPFRSRRLSTKPRRRRKRRCGTLAAGDLGCGGLRGVGWLL